MFSDLCCFLHKFVERDELGVVEVLEEIVVGGEAGFDERGVLGEGEEGVELVEIEEVGVVALGVVDLGD